jgi:carbon storage regulator CsrA
MLILSRRRGESIRIHKHITVLVLSITPSRVDLGVTAPAWMAVDREEVYQRKRVSGAGSPKPPKTS